MGQEESFFHNGLHVIYVYQPGPLTALSLTVRAGARFDGLHPGIAHLAEHMLFQGTAELDQLALNRLAAGLGGNHNANTNYETMALTLDVFNENLDAGVRVLAGQFYHSQVPPERFRSERLVVLDEIRGRNSDPVEVLHRDAWCTFFSGALAHPICGSLSSVRRTSRTAVLEFLRTHFLHAKTALAVVGGAGLEQVREAVERHFVRQDPADPPETPAVSLGNGGLVEHRGRSSVGFVVLFLAPPLELDALLATSLALELIAGGPDSILFQEVRQRFGLGYDVSGSLQWGPDWAVVTMGSSTALKQVGQLEEVLNGICERTVRDGFSREEVEHARKKVRYRQAMLVEDRLELACALAEATVLGLPSPLELGARLLALEHSRVEQAWRQTVQGHRLVARLK